MKQYLQTKNYPGRGMLFGITADANNVFMAYFLMGRSKNSRNRILKEEGQRILAAPFDASLVEDPSLIFYTPVQPFNNSIIITNGIQTDTIFEHLRNGSTFENALNTLTYEPDAPHYTPRISGLLSMHERGLPSLKLSILHKEEGSARCNRVYFNTVMQPGKAHLLHTYAGENDGRLLPFCGPPVEASLPLGGIKTISAELWESLDADNRVSLYACLFPLDKKAPTRILYNRNPTPIKRMLP